MDLGRKVIPLVAHPREASLGVEAGQRPAAAPRGAGTIAAWGECFAAAMAEVGASEDAGLRASLLPPGHDPAIVARRFEEIVLKLC